MSKFDLKHTIAGSLAVIALICSIQGSASAGNIIRQALPDLTAAIKPDLPSLDPAMMLEDGSVVRLVVKLGQRRVFVYQGDELKGNFPVAVGRAGWETPKGNFKVLNMEKNPAWKNPWTGDVIKAGRDNPMGERAIDFWTDGRVFAAFHGTTNESLVGQAVSHGCIRMRNADIRIMYDMVSMGTPVIIEP